MITQSRLKELLIYHKTTGHFYWKVDRRGGAKAKDLAGRITAAGYVEIRVDLKFYRAHRLAWIYLHGELEQSMQIDHVNGNRSDNRISNLRLATPKQNKENFPLRRAQTRSGLLGVCWNKRISRWKARICNNGKRINLGHFKTAEGAHAAYMRAKRKLHTCIRREEH